VSCFFDSRCSFRSSAVAKPHHELAAYTSFATTTDLKMMLTEAAVMPWVLSIRRAWTLCEHEEMTDTVLVTVTPRTFMTSTRLMLARVATVIFLTYCLPVGRLHLKAFLQKK